MIAFVHPWFLLLLIPTGLVLWAFAVKKQPSVRIPSVEPARSGAVKRRFLNWKTLLPFILYTISMVLLVIAFARPREGLEEIRRRAEGIDIMIALDLSGSMAAIDIPRNVTTSGALESGIADGSILNRINTAKREIAKFIKARPNDRIGLIAFAPLPYTACPPTLDHAWLIANLDRLDAGVIGDNTNIAAPLASAIRRLKDSDARRKIIVLFTDGRNNVADKVTPRQAAKLASTFDITVYTVGIGSGNSVIKQNLPFGRSRLFPVQNEFDEPLLKDIASETSGKYYHAADAEGMAAAMKEIDGLEKTSFEQQTTVNWREIAPRIVLAALVFLLAGVIFEQTFCLKTP